MQRKFKVRHTPVRHVSAIEKGFRMEDLERRAPL